MTDADKKNTESSAGKGSDTKSLTSESELNASDFIPVTKQVVVGKYHCFLGLKDICINFIYLYSMDLSMSIKSNRVHQIKKTTLFKCDKLKLIHGTCINKIYKVI